MTANTQLQDFYENTIVPTAKRLGVFGSDAADKPIGGSLNAANAQLQDLQTQYQNAATQADRDRLQGQITTLQNQIKTMSSEIDSPSGSLSAGASPLDTSALTVKGADSLTTISSVINFDVLGTLSSAVSTYVPVFATAVGDFQSAVGELGAMLNSRSRDDAQYVSYRGNRGNT